MKYYRKGALTALAVVAGLAAQSASAQGLRGFRVKVQTGYNSFHSEGTKHGKWGRAVPPAWISIWAASYFDPNLTYWWAPNENETHEARASRSAREFVPRVGIGAAWRRERYPFHPNLRQDRLRS